MAPGVLELAAWMRGIENFYTDLAANRDFACALLDKVTDIKMRYWELALAEVGDRIVVVSEADDMASQTGLMMSPETFRRIIKPRHKRLLEFIRRLAPNAFIFFHSCGSIYDVIPDLIEVGVDILNPVQYTAAGMEARRLKKEFGDALTFWGGGIDTQRILPYGTPQEVKDEVRRRIDDLAPGGGFVFNTIHNIQPDVPPENIAAMIEALREFGVYS
jgi:uroporphyrinogen decarboxylase